MDIDSKFSDVCNKVHSDAELTLESLKSGFGLGDAPRLRGGEVDEWMTFKTRGDGFVRARHDECFNIRKVFPGSS